MELARLPDSLRKRPKESDSAHSALIHYYELGPGRSIGALYDLFMQQAREGIAVPTESYNTLGSWSSKFEWGNRIEQVQRDQYAAEIEELHGARIKFVRKQVDMLELWERMLIMGLPNLEDVSFDKWSKSAKDFVSAIGEVFGLEQAKEVNVNVRNDASGPIDVNAATTELMGLIESVRERASLDAFANSENVIDVESEPA